MKRILVTLGPSSLKEDVIKSMTKSHIYLFRINLSHTKLEDLVECINIIRNSTAVPICLDSEGAQIRSQTVENGKIVLQRNCVVKIHDDEILGDAENLSFSPKRISRQFVVGDQINVDFDLVSIEIIEKQPKHCLAKVLKGGSIQSNKAADIGRELRLEGITEKDKKAFLIGKEMGIFNFALSFASSMQDVMNCRDIVGNNSKVISKIESRRGLANIKGIIDNSDGILIDRGDLSRQVSIEKVPFFQRRIISLCRLYDTPVYVATNLLESMIKAEMPTRAEVNDIASTVLMGADGLVLAAETAVGAYPVESVQVVRNLCELCRRWTPNTSINEILEM